MKRLILIVLLVLVVMIPNLVFAGNVYSPTVKATFYNEAKYTSPGLTGAKGSATITYSNGIWNVSMNFSGLLKKQAYIFQFGLQGQLVPYYDISFTTDKTGKFANTFYINDLDDVFPNGFVDILGYAGGYTMLRLIDLSGKSGGMLLDSLEPDGNSPDDDPYEGTPATMVMRAREDGYRGSLIFY
ncbi:TPA: hypothetical protein ENS27_17025 [bacterium]|nr:hypothetical protein [bacterium]